VSDCPITLDKRHLDPEVTAEKIAGTADRIRKADEVLRPPCRRYERYTGWLDPDRIRASGELAEIKQCADELRDESDALLVIGIGGSYLGARAAIEALSDEPDRVLYAGTDISAWHVERIRRQLKGKDVAINVISKSGTTTEPAIAFRLLRDLVPKADQSRMIVATTDATGGALLKLAEKAGCERFVVPHDIGGRFSVLSAVGLLPIAYAGIDIDALVSGAAECAEVCKQPENPAYQYAAARNLLYEQGKAIEILASFEPRLHYFAEWWKQLFGESEGKNGKALFPASVDFTADLHSLGQYIQEGRRILFETFLIVKGGEPSVVVPESDDDSDELNYLHDKELSWINEIAYEAVAQAHRDGGVPNLAIELDKLDVHSLGALIYFLEIACAISALMLDVNPFDQPGVEAYKKLMFKMLGKPGYT